MMLLSVPGSQSAAAAAAPWQSVRPALAAVSLRLSASAGPVPEPPGPCAGPPLTSTAPAAAGNDSGGHGGGRRSEAAATGVTVTRDRPH